MKVAVIFTDISRKLFVKLHVHANEGIYEAYRSKVLSNMMTSSTPDTLKADILAGRPSFEDTKMLSKIELITRKAAERLRLSSSIDSVLN